MNTKQIQHLLAYLGYYTGGIDGKWGPLSEAATISFQRDFGIDDDGIVGAETGKALKHAVSYGMPQKEEESEEDSFWGHIRYWSREEFRCRCGETHDPYCDGFPVEPDQTLVELVDDIRHDMGAKGIRSSGLRCPQHNAEQKGSAPNSKHLEGKALDFKIIGVSASRVLARAKSDPRCDYAYIIDDGPYVHVNVK